MCCVGLIVGQVFMMRAATCRDDASANVNEASFDYQCPARLHTLVKPEAQRVEQQLERMPVQWLYQNNFSSGSLRITQPGHYVFAEDVVFEPNPNHDWRPRPEQQQYGHKAFRLGFFGGIVVESDNVLISLNGHRFSSSDVFMLQQKVFSLIELGTQPFIPGFGPADFGNSSIGPHNVVIRHGTLGPTQHHCVHGNGVHTLYIHNVTMTEYEVASVSMNAGKAMVISNVTATGHRTVVPVLGTYSQARFITLFAEMLLKSPTAIPAAVRTQLTAANERLYTLMNETLADIRATGFIDGSAHPEAFALFDNEARIPDGNVYGMVFHPLGPAVDSFWHEEPRNLSDPRGTGDLLIENTYIYEAQVRVIEVVALASNAHGVVRGPAGDVLRIRDNANKLSVMTGTQGHFLPNALVNVQYAFAEAAEYAPPHLRERFFTLSFTPEVRAWMRGERTLASIVSSGSHHYIRNGDTMFHVNKGALGVRVDGARNVCMSNVVVSGVTNKGALGNASPLPGEQGPIFYHGPDDGGHPAQGPLQTGFTGGDARGISIAASTNVVLRETTVANVYARRGTARGIHIFNKVGELRYGRNMRIENVSSIMTESDVVANAGTNMGSSAAAIGQDISGGSVTRVKGVLNVKTYNITSRMLNVAYDHIVDAQEEDFIPRSLAELANTFTL